MFYSWKVCMRHDLPTICRSPALALALSHYFLSLKHRFFTPTCAAGQNLAQCDTFDWVCSGHKGKVITTLEWPRDTRTKEKVDFLRIDGQLISQES